MIVSRDVGVIPLTDAAGITKPYNYPSHKGIDIGWAETPVCPVLAWQDGVVVQRGYGSEVGNYIVVEHYYDGEDTKRWTGYIHLSYFPTVKVGDKVYLGQQMGNAARGNTGKSNGTHLHLYLTKCVPQRTPYTWDTMLANVTDPYPYLYWSKEINNVYISSEWKKELKEMNYPKPVERNELVNQCEIKSDTRRMRKAPSLKGVAYDEYCKRGIYNVYKWQNADGYDWALIDTLDGNQFWVAVMAGEDLPVLDYKELYEREKEKNKTLADEVNKLEVENIKLEEEYASISKDHMTLTGKLKRIKEIVEE